MSAFIVNRTHLDYLLTFAMAHNEYGSPLSWMAPAEEEPAEATHQRGEPWGPGAVDHYRARRRELTPETASAVGAILAAENRRSVDHRYDETEMEDFYTFTPYRLGMSPVQTLKAIDCYEYQSCEHPEWHTSEAHEICQALRKRAIHALVGYDEAAWEIPYRPTSGKKRGR